MALAAELRVADDAGVFESRNSVRRRSKARRIVAASIVALGVIAAAAASCGGRSSNDATAVETLFEKQLALAKAGDWQGLYNTYSPRYQSRCPTRRC